MESLHWQIAYTVVAFIVGTLIVPLIWRLWDWRSNMDERFLLRREFEAFKSEMKEDIKRIEKKLDYLINSLYLKRNSHEKKE